MNAKCHAQRMHDPNDRSNSYMASNRFLAPEDESGAGFGPTFAAKKNDLLRPLNYTLSPPSSIGA
jgi:hypothetical protein